uniref:Putative lipocalin-3 1 n=1 Tax=Amblyomma triste TaxID=251400 RepID=A0A023G2Y0_AMBTT
MFTAGIFFVLIRCLSSSLAVHEDLHRQLLTRTANYSDIKEFLNTSEPIWTYNSTKEYRVYCKRDVMYNITNEMIIFNRSYEYKNDSISYWVQGDFFYPEGWQIPIAILIGMPGGLKDGYELFLYKNDANTCGVFNTTITFTGEPFFWFDLRVTNSSITTGPANDCLQFYYTVVHYYKKRRMVRTRTAVSIGPSPLRCYFRIPPCRFLQVVQWA